jgi:hypothetical protein
MRRYHLTIAGKNFEVEIQSVGGGQARVLVNGRPYEVTFRSAPEGPRCNRHRTRTPGRNSKKRARRDWKKSRMCATLTPISVASVHSCKISAPASIMFWQKRCDCVPPMPPAPTVRPVRWRDAWQTSNPIWTHSRRCSTLRWRGAVRCRMRRTVHRAKPGRTCVPVRPCTFRCLCSFARGGTIHGCPAKRSCHHRGTADAASN